jgi:hypothetical protein
MAVDNEKDREQWTRFTLRMPPGLQDELTLRSEPLSLNAYIVQILNRSLTVDAELDRLLKFIDVLELERRDLLERLLRMEKQLTASVVPDDLAKLPSSFEQFKEDIRQTVRETIEQTLAEKAKNQKK